MHRKVLGKRRVIKAFSNPYTSTVSNALERSSAHRVSVLPELQKCFTNIRSVKMA